MVYQVGSTKRYFHFLSTTRIRCPDIDDNIIQIHEIAIVEPNPACRIVANIARKTTGLIRYLKASESELKSRPIISKIRR